MADVPPSQIGAAEWSQRVGRMAALHQPAWSSWLQKQHTAAHTSDGADTSDTGFGGAVVGIGVLSGTLVPSTLASAGASPASASASAAKGKGRASSAQPKRTVIPSSASAHGTETAKSGVDVGDERAAGYNTNTIHNVNTSAAVTRPQSATPYYSRSLIQAKRQQQEEKEGKSTTGNTSMASAVPMAVRIADRSSRIGGRSLSRPQSASAVPIRGLPRNAGTFAGGAKQLGGGDEAASFNISTGMGKPSTAASDNASVHRSNSSSGGQLKRKGSASSKRTKLGLAPNTSVEGAVISAASYQRVADISHFYLDDNVGEGGDAGDGWRAADAEGVTCNIGGEEHSPLPTFAPSCDVSVVVAEEKSGGDGVSQQSPSSFSRAPQQLRSQAQAQQPTSGAIFPTVRAFESASAANAVRTELLIGEALLRAARSFGLLGAASGGGAGAAGGGAYPVATSAPPSTADTSAVGRYGGGPLRGAYSQSPQPQPQNDACVNSTAVADAAAAASSRIRTAHSSSIAAMQRDGVVDTFSRPFLAGEAARSAAASAAGGAIGGEGGGVYRASDGYGLTDNSQASALTAAAAAAVGKGASVAGEAKEAASLGDAVAVVGGDASSYALSALALLEASAVALGSHPTLGPLLSCLYTALSRGLVSGALPLASSAVAAEGLDEKVRPAKGKSKAAAAAADLTRWLADGGGLIAAGTGGTVGGDFAATLQRWVLARRDTYTAETRTFSDIAKQLRGDGPGDPAAAAAATAQALVQQRRQRRTLRQHFIGWRRAVYRKRRAAAVAEVRFQRQYGALSLRRHFEAWRREAAVGRFRKLFGEQTEARFDLQIERKAKNALATDMQSATLRIASLESERRGLIAEVGAARATIADLRSPMVFDFRRPLRDQNGRAVEAGSLHFLLKEKYAYSTINTADLWMGDFGSVVPPAGVTLPGREMQQSHYVIRVVPAASASPTAFSSGFLGGGSGGASSYSAGDWVQWANAQVMRYCRLAGSGPPIGAARSAAMAVEAASSTADGDGGADNNAERGGDSDAGIAQQSPPAADIPSAAASSSSAPASAAASPRRGPHHFLGGGGGGHVEPEVLALHRHFMARRLADHKVRTVAAERFRLERRESNVCFISADVTPEYFLGSAADALRPVDAATPSPAAVASSSTLPTSDGDALMAGQRNESKDAPAGADTADSSTPSSPTSSAASLVPAAVSIAARTTQYAALMPPYARDAFFASLARSARALRGVGGGGINASAADCGQLSSASVRLERGMCARSGSLAGVYFFGLPSSFSSASSPAQRAALLRLHSLYKALCLVGVMADISFDDFTGEAFGFMPTSAPDGEKENENASEKENEDGVSANSSSAKAVKSTSKKKTTVDTAAIAPSSSTSNSNQTAAPSLLFYAVPEVHDLIMARLLSLDVMGRCSDALARLRLREARRRAEEGLGEGETLAPPSRGLSISVRGKGLLGAPSHSSLSLGFGGLSAHGTALSVPSLSRRGGGHQHLSSSAICEPLRTLQSVAWGSTPQQQQQQPSLASVGGGGDPLSIAATSSSPAFDAANSTDFEAAHLLLWVKHVLLSGSGSGSGGAGVGPVAYRADVSPSLPTSGPPSLATAAAGVNISVAETAVSASSATATPNAGHLPLPTAASSTPTPADQHHNTNASASSSHSFLSPERLLAITNFADAFGDGLELIAIIVQSMRPLDARGDVLTMVEALSQRYAHSNAANDDDGGDDAEGNAAAHGAVGGAATDAPGSSAGSPPLSFATTLGPQHQPQRSTMITPPPPSAVSSTASAAPHNSTRIVAPSELGLFLAAQLLCEVAACELHCHIPPIVRQRLHTCTPDSRRQFVACLYNRASVVAGALAAAGVGVGTCMGSPSSPSASAASPQYAFPLATSAYVGFSFADSTSVHFSPITTASGLFTSLCGPPPPPLSSTTGGGGGGDVIISPPASGCLSFGGVAAVARSGPIVGGRGAGSIDFGNASSSSAVFSPASALSPPSASGIAGAAGGAAVSIHTVLQRLLLIGGGSMLSFSASSAAANTAATSAAHQLTAALASLGLSSGSGVGFAGGPSGRIGGSRSAAAAAAAAQQMPQVSLLAALPNVFGRKSAAVMAFRGAASVVAVPNVMGTTTHHAHGHSSSSQPAGDGHSPVSNSSPPLPTSSATPTAQQQQSSSTAALPQQQHQQQLLLHAPPTSSSSASASTASSGLTLKAFALPMAYESSRLMGFLPDAAAAAAFRSQTEPLGSAFFAVFCGVAGRVLPPLSSAETVVSLGLPPSTVVGSGFGSGGGRSLSSGASAFGGTEGVHHQHSSADAATQQPAGLSWDVRCLLAFDRAVNPSYYSCPATPVWVPAPTAPSASASSTEKQQQQQQIFLPSPLQLLREVQLMRAFRDCCGRGAAAVSAKDAHRLTVGVAGAYRDHVRSGGGAAIYAKQQLQQKQQQSDAAASPFSPPQLLGGTLPPEREGAHQGLRRGASFASSNGGGGATNAGSSSGGAAIAQQAAKAGLSALLSPGALLAAAGRPASAKAAAARGAGSAGGASASSPPRATRQRGGDRPALTQEAIRSILSSSATTTTAATGADASPTTFSPTFVFGDGEGEKDGVSLSADVVVDWDDAMSSGTAATTATRRHEASVNRQHCEKMVPPTVLLLLHQSLAEATERLRVGFAQWPELMVRCAVYGCDATMAACGVPLGPTGHSFEAAQRHYTHAAASPSSGAGGILSSPLRPASAQASRSAFGASALPATPPSPLVTVHTTAVPPPSQLSTPQAYDEWRRANVSTVDAFVKTLAHRIAASIAGGGDSGLWVPFVAQSLAAAPLGKAALEAALLTGGAVAASAVPSQLASSPITGDAVTAPAGAAESGDASALTSILPPPPISASAPLPLMDLAMSWDDYFATTAPASGVPIAALVPWASTNNNRQQNAATTAMCNNNGGAAASASFSPSPTPASVGLMGMGSLTWAPLSGGGGGGGGNSFGAVPPPSLLRQQLPPSSSSFASAPLPHDGASSFSGGGAANNNNAQQSNQTTASLSQPQHNAVVAVPAFTVVAASSIDTLARGPSAAAVFARYSLAAPSSFGGGGKGSGGGGGRWDHRSAAAGRIVTVRAFALLCVELGLCREGSLEEIGQRMAAAALPATTFNPAFYGVAAAASAAARAQQQQQALSAASFVGPSPAAARRRQSLSTSQAGRRLTVALRDTAAAAAAAAASASFESKQQQQNAAALSAPYGCLSAGPAADASSPFALGSALLSPLPFRALLQTFFLVAACQQCSAAQPWVAGFAEGGAAAFGGGFSDGVNSAASGGGGGGANNGGRRRKGSMSAGRAAPPSRSGSTFGEGQPIPSSAADGGGGGGSRPPSPGPTVDVARPMSAASQPLVSAHGSRGGGGGGRRANSAGAFSNSHGGAGGGALVTVVTRGHSEARTAAFVDATLAVRPSDATADFSPSSLHAVAAAAPSVSSSSSLTSASAGPSVLRHSAFRQLLVFMASSLVPAPWVPLPQRLEALLAHMEARLLALQL